MWMLVVVEDGKIVFFVYIKEVKVVGFKLIIWILECFGLLVNGGGWYFQIIKEVINNDVMYMELFDVLV